MQIISNNECYVQKVDLIHLNQLGLLPSKLKELLTQTDKDFIKIEDKKLIDFIINSDIPSYKELMLYDVNTLEKMIRKIKGSILDDIYDEESCEQMERLNEQIIKRKTREYLISQITEIINHKLHKSTLRYPDIPDPSKFTFKTDELCASITLNEDKVVIYNVDGSRVYDPEDKAFCEIAFKLLTCNYLDEDNLELNMGFDGNYFVVEELNPKKNINLRRTRQ